MPKYNYQTEKIAAAREKTTRLSGELPPIVGDYILSTTASMAASSQLSYIYNIRDFLKWWHKNIRNLSEKDIREITVEDLAEVTPRDINEYLYTYLTSQGSRTVARSCAALSSFFDYLVNMCGLAANPLDKVMRPKFRKDKRIIRLEQDEITALLSAVENGCSAMSDRQQKYLMHTKERDYAIITLLLSTGIRVSECVGLDIDDIFFKTHQMQITRKGEKKQTLAIGDEALKAIKDYLIIREKIDPLEAKDKRALFLSTRNTRLGTAAIENMVTKYTEALGFGKHITPHKFRKTYGTALYNETRDIYLVANALGHESVNTTTDHYVASDLEDLQAVRNAIRLNPNKEGD